MPPRRQLQRRLTEAGHQASDRLHAHFRIEDDIRRNLGDLFDPLLRFFRTLHEAIYLTSCPTRLSIASRSKVIQNQFELLPIELRDQAAQNDVPNRVPSHVCTDNQQPRASRRHLQPALSNSAGMPVPRCGWTHDFAVTAERSADVLRTV